MMVRSHLESWRGMSVPSLANFGVIQGNCEYVSPAAFGTIRGKNDVSPAPDQQEYQTTCRVENAGLEIS
eukprot:scaffold94685_cov19-Tisochrysis_lutea.AAC.1